MDKDKEKGEMCEGCACGCHNHGMWGHRHWGHMLIKVFIVMFIFWAGVQFGELKATVENNFGGMMGGWGGNAFYLKSGQSFGPGMMAGWTTAAPDGTTIRMMQVGTSTRY